MDDMGVSHQRIADLLTKAATTIKEAPDAEPWDYGWFLPDYRRSERAALDSPDGPVTMTPDGVSAYEEAVESLLNQASIRDRWDGEEIWGLVASLVVTASQTGDASGFITRNLPKIIKPSPALVVFPVANIEWSDAPMLLGGKCAIGNAGIEFTELVANLGGRASSAKEIITEFTKQQKHQRPLVCFAMLVSGQREMAFRQASRQFEMLVDISLLLDIDKEGHGLHSSRGAWNRPGVRGLMLDRGAIERSMRGKESAVELVSHPLIYDELGRSGGHHWYSAEPLPLQDVLSHERLRNAVVKSLVDPGSIYRRLRVAGKWFSEAFWSSNPDDATLALGVALDALIGAKNGLPGRAMKERFALLDDAPQKRSLRAKQYDELYRVRSTVAHGGLSSKVQEKGFVKNFQREVTWTAWRLIAMQADFSVSSDADLDETFESLRWGTSDWPNDGKGKEISAMLRPDAGSSTELAEPQPCGSERSQDE
ncbi:hypothetical protein ACH4FA_08975 [Streptomyces sp. NPDC017966]|uniref:hypothetical protein n=1 Tax=Streptomyces sp. NPDC017966 TaxID=3365023 RepID=UPI0037A0C472